MKANFIALINSQDVPLSWCLIEVSSVRLRSNAAPARPAAGPAPPPAPPASLLCPWGTHQGQDLPCGDMGAGGGLQK